MVNHKPSIFAALSTSKAFITSNTLQPKPGRDLPALKGSPPCSGTKMSIDVNRYHSKLLLYPVIHHNSIYNLHSFTIVLYHSISQNGIDSIVFSPLFVANVPPVLPCNRRCHGTLLAIDHPRFATEAVDNCLPVDRHISAEKLLVVG